MRSEEGRPALDPKPRKLEVPPLIGTESEVSQARAHKAIREVMSDELLEEKLIHIAGLNAG